MTPMTATKSKVLLADDEPDALRTFGDILTSAGYEVATAASGEEALRTLDRFPADVILLDIMLPGKDGIEIARELSRRTVEHPIPIVLITALNSFPCDETGFADIPGIRRFIYKPCRPKTLLEAIDHVLRYPY